eukprot:2308183-Rhodomonas_salina.1
MWHWVGWEGYLSWDVDMRLPGVGPLGKVGLGSGHLSVRGLGFIKSESLAKDLLAEEFVAIDSRQWGF